MLSTLAAFGGLVQPLVYLRISMVSDPREFTVPFKNAQSKLIEHAAPTPSKAACVLSMVFELGGLLLLGV